MNQNYLDYVRGELSVALADIQRSGKGQLAAFEDTAMANTTRFKRKRIRNVEVGGRKVSQAADPMHCPETRTRKKPFPPLENLSYVTSSWRRAIGTLDKPQEAWLRYCYANDISFDGQVAICQFVWGELSRGLKGKRITAKVRKRVESLVWLAVQQESKVLGCVIGREYSHTELATMSGVSKSTWSENYSGHWGNALRLVHELDGMALRSIASARIDERSKQISS